MNRIAIIGLFRNGCEASDGQSIKTRIITQEIENIMGADRIHRIDTYKWKKHPAKLFFNCVHAVWSNEHVVFMTDEGGIKVFPWLLTIANIFKRCKVHYVVIGGWLIRSIDQKKLRRFWLKKLNGIYVETTTMKLALESNGLANVVLLPNCKRLSILKENELINFNKEPFPLCTFSRVMREKGIQDAVEAIRRINHHFGRQVYTLDIYGQVDAKQQDWFEKLKDDFPQGVRYCGVAPFYQSAEILKTYFALLFPTKFYTEGVPGTIIDAFSAGVPVIASQWESYHDIMDDGTCIGYSFGSFSGLLACLEKVAMNPSLIKSKKKACLKRAQQYSPECAMKPLLTALMEKDNN